MNQLIIKNLSDLVDLYKKDPKFKFKVNDILNSEWGVVAKKLSIHGNALRTNSIAMEKTDIQMQNIVDAQTLSPFERHLKEVQIVMAMMGATAAWCSPCLYTSSQKASHKGKLSQHDPN